ncbi:uncharacterized protein F4817DRAFT_87117 [Daldinia loculata]|uniref:uncharacterized protein n=1 Tax=Daldinia loculata TaxID=103429 RepID=UPI0020C53DB9|nr:uncharacterized protein F4817DRAFT_87117 [Daldinia loculata]KAI1651991.1 hypothetical protein F4817DRAFT_87117 [Daldinia loculata]
MGDPLGAVSSIIGIASFGLKFATTLQTYIEAVADAEENLRGIALDVSATASALKQLDEYMRPDQSGKAIASDSGVEEVARLASQCEQVYTVIIYLIAKAVGVPKDDNGKVSLDALDLHSLNAPSRMQKLIWPFRESRIRKHREELRWLKFSLLFHLGLIELAKTRKMGPARSPDAYERELALHAKVEKLHAKMEAYINKITSRRRREKNKARKKPPTGSSSSIIDEVISRSSSFKRSKSPNPGLHYVVDNTPNAPARLPGSSAVEDNENLENNASHPKQTEPLQQFAAQEMTSANPAAPQAQRHTQNTQIDAQYSPLNVDTSQQTARPRSSNASNEKEPAPQNNPIGHARVKEWYTPEPSPETLGAFSWVSSLFRTRDRFVHDWKSQEVEGYLVEGDTGTIRKLPFSRQKLTEEITRITKSRQGDVWAQYASFTSAQREIVDRVMAEANRSSHRARSCVAISQQLGWSQGQSYIAVFFSLSAVQPVHVKFGVKYFQFAFELCRTWEGIDGLIRQTVHEINIPNSYLIGGRYELRGLDGNVIPRAMWRTAVHPGLVVFITIPQSISKSTSKSTSKSRTGSFSDEEDSGSVVLTEDLDLRLPAPGFGHRVLRRIKDKLFRSHTRALTEVMSNGSSSSVGSAESPPAPVVRSTWHPESDNLRAAETVVKEKARRGVKREEEEGEDEEEDVDIINFEEEKMHARLGLAAQLNMWTTVFDTVENNKNGEDGL